MTGLDRFGVVRAYRLIGRDRAVRVISPFEGQVISTSASLERLARRVTSSPAGRRALGMGALVLMRVDADGEITSLSRGEQRAVQNLARRRHTVVGAGR